MPKHKHRFHKPKTFPHAKSWRIQKKWNKQCAEWFKNLPIANLPKAEWNRPPNRRPERNKNGELR